MTVQPWVRSHLWKVVAALVLSLLLLQYVFQSRQLEPLFAINTSTFARTRTHPHPRPSAPRGLLFQESGNTSSGLTSAPSSSGNSSVSTVDAVSAANFTLPLCPPIPPNLRNSSKGIAIRLTLCTKLLSLSPGLCGELSSQRFLLFESPDENNKRIAETLPEGPIRVIKEAPSLEKLETLFPMLQHGGHYLPPYCQARDKVAIVVPYRDRAQHLSVLLVNLHPFLQHQQLEYRIIIVEQAGKGAFNRAMLMNIGFAEALKLYNFDCFIFHDVDLLPEDDRNLYTCPEQPRHMSVAIDVFKYKLPYTDIFGGVSAMTREQFQKVNGFSNMFWGWGGEDDDMSNRIKFNGYHISRYPTNIARYKMLSHRKQRANPKRYEFLNTGRKRFHTDGLNSLKYERKELKLHKAYTQIVVELGGSS